MSKINLNSSWRIEPTAVYYTIKNEDNAIVCFMSLSEKDREIAEHICKIHNEKRYSFEDILLKLIEEKHYIRKKYTGHFYTVEEDEKWISYEQAEIDGFIEFLTRIYQ